MASPLADAGMRLLGFPGQDGGKRGSAPGLVHEGTAIWDVRAAVDGGREVRPAEQHIHSFLESLPFMAISALCCLHWDQVADREAWTARPGLRPRRLPARYLAGVFAAVAAFVVAPYAEELTRCLRARRVDCAGSAVSVGMDGSVTHCSAR